MIKLNVGNVWTDEFLDKVIALNKEHENDCIRISSLYGSIRGLTPTARSNDRLPGIQSPSQYIQRAQENDINIRYTLNPSCIGSLQDFRTYWDKELREVLYELHDAGIHEWTVASPLLVELIKNMFPDDFVEVSTIAEVSNVSQAMLWKELGADGVNASIMVNRDLQVIHDIVDTRLEVSLLANEACLYNCPWRRECYNLSSHNSHRSGFLFGHYPFDRCQAQRLEYPEKWVSARMILPQWMMYYQKATGVNWFKITGRTHPYEVIVPIIETYMNQYHGGNLLELWPTISALGNSEEPMDRTFISCVKLDSFDFIRKAVQVNCQETTCSDCGLCRKAYDFAKVED